MATLAYSGSRAFLPGLFLNSIVSLEFWSSSSFLRCQDAKVNLCSKSKRTPLMCLDGSRVDELMCQFFEESMHGFIVCEFPKLLVVTGSQQKDSAHRCLQRGQNYII